MANVRICDICQRNDVEIGSPLGGIRQGYRLPKDMCHGCFVAWYDHGLTEVNNEFLEVSRQENEINEKFMQKFKLTTPTGEK